MDHHAELRLRKPVHGRCPPNIQPRCSERRNHVYLVRAKWVFVRNVDYRVVDPGVDFDDAEPETLLQPEEHIHQHQQQVPVQGQDSDPIFQ